MRTYEMFSSYMRGLWFGVWFVYVRRWSSFGSFCFMVLFSLWAWLMALFRGRGCFAEFASGFVDAFWRPADDVCPLVMPVDFEGGDYRG